jgi:hypothetical protein
MQPRLQIPEWGRKEQGKTKAGDLSMMNKPAQMTAADPIGLMMGSRLSLEPTSQKVLCPIPDSLCRPHHKL